MTRPGRCATPRGTLFACGGNDCDADAVGLWGGPTRPVSSREECAILCSRCSNCRYLSFSHNLKLCFWFKECDLQNLERTSDDGANLLDFRSFIAPAAPAPPFKQQVPTYQNGGGETRGSKGALVAPTTGGAGGNARRAVPLSRAAAGAPSWSTRDGSALRFAGTCGITPEWSPDGESSTNCSTAASGAWKASAKGVTSLAQCEALCSRCLNCRYVSFSLHFDDCSWFRDCKLSRLRLMDKAGDNSFASFCSKEVARRIPDPSHSLTK
eukprot:6541841-Prymnesium_polylepis.1